MTNPEHVYSPANGSFSILHLLLFEVWLQQKYTIDFALISIRLVILALPSLSKKRPIMLISVDCMC